MADKSEAGGCLILLVVCVVVGCVCGKVCGGNSSSDPETSDAKDACVLMMRHDSELRSSSDKLGKLKGMGWAATLRSRACDSAVDALGPEGSASAYRDHVSYYLARAWAEASGY